MHRHEDGWIRKYEKKQALWIHDEDKRRPHALLTSGNHSNGFFNSRLIISDEKLLDEAASDLVELFVQACDGKVHGINVSVGPQTGATKLCELIANHIKAHTGELCAWASPAKFEQEGKKQMVFTKEDCTKLWKSHVLLCEDVLTTGGSVELAERAVVKAGGRVLPFILTLVNRSGLTRVNGKKVIALINRKMPIWTPEECPLCKEGSKTLLPKDTKNWEELNAVLA